MMEKRTRGATWSFRCKQELQGRKRQGCQIYREKDERGAMQFQAQAGAPREENVMGAKLTEKRTRGAPCSFKCKQGLQGRKRQGRQIDGEKDERGTMKFQVQAGAPGKITSRAAKLTEKRTREVLCSFRCKRGLQGRKRQGRHIDGEKDERGAMEFQVQVGAPGKKTSGAPN